MSARIWILHHLQLHNTQRFDKLHNAYCFDQVRLNSEVGKVLQAVALIALKYFFGLHSFF